MFDNIIDFEKSFSVEDVTIERQPTGPCPPNENRIVSSPSIAERRNLGLRLVPYDEELSFRL